MMGMKMKNKIKDTDATKYNPPGYNWFLNLPGKGPENKECICGYGRSASRESGGVFKTESDCIKAMNTTFCTECDTCKPTESPAPGNVSTGSASAAFFINDF
jgi:hypothetical protein